MKASVQSKEIKSRVSGDLYPISCLTSDNKNFKSKHTDVILFTREGSLESNLPEKNLALFPSDKYYNPAEEVRKRPNQ